MKKKENWDLVIEGKTSLLDISFKDLWRYRDLLLMFVKRDFVSFYKQTILGPLWFFIQPLFTTIVYTFVFGNLAKISTDGLPQQLFYLTGITAWNYFADCLTKTSTVFKDNANIFGKVYFPRLIMPLSIVASNLVRFGVQLILLLIMMGYYYFFSDMSASFHFSKAIFFFPILVLLMAFLGLGMGLIITAVTTKYKDLTFLITFGVQLINVHNNRNLSFKCCAKNLQKIYRTQSNDGYYRSFPIRIFRERRIYNLVHRLLRYIHANCLVFRGGNI